MEEGLEGTESEEMVMDEVMDSESVDVDTTESPE